MKLKANIYKWPRPKQTKISKLQIASNPVLPRSQPLANNEIQFNVKESLSISMFKCGDLVSNIPSETLQKHFFNECWYFNELKGNIKADPQDTENMRSCLEPHRCLRLRVALNNLLPRTVPYIYLFTVSRCFLYIAYSTTNCHRSMVAGTPHP